MDSFGHGTGQTENLVWLVYKGLHCSYDILHVDPLQFFCSSSSAKFIIG